MVTIHLEYIRKYSSVGFGDHLQLGLMNLKGKSSNVLRLIQHFSPNLLSMKALARVLVKIFNYLSIEYKLIMLCVSLLIKYYRLQSRKSVGNERKK